jgi:hypothetical protein
MRESTVERHLRTQVEAHGGLTRKFISPGHKGVPDRIVWWPEGVVHFIETKAPGKKPDEAQQREHRRLSALGAMVMVLDTTEQVDFYILRWSKK